MRFGDRDQPTQALAPIAPISRSQSAFAIGLRGGDLSPASPSRLIDSSRLGEDAVAIMDQVSVAILIADGFTQRCGVQAALG